MKLRTLERILDERDQVLDMFISILVIHRIGTVLACNCLFSGINHAELGYEPSLSFLIHRLSINLLIPTDIDDLEYPK